MWECDDSKDGNLRSIELYSCLRILSLIIEFYNYNIYLIFFFEQIYILYSLSYTQTDVVRIIFR